MPLFNFFKKKPQPSPEVATTKSSDILLAMPLFANNKYMDVNQVIDYLTSYWGAAISDIEISADTSSFKIDDETVAIAFLEFPIPKEDIEGTAQYAYNWPSAIKDLENHTGHAIVTILSSPNASLNRFAAFTKVLHAILQTSESVGIYNGTQSLLIPKSQYIAYAEELENGKLPAMLWVYVGLRRVPKGNSAYTYGLKLFNKNEIEIIESQQPIEELFDFLVNLTTYIINSDVTLKQGETVGLTMEQKIPVTISPAVFVEGQSIKLSM